MGASGVSLFDFACILTKDFFLSFLCPGAGGGGAVPTVLVSRKTAAHPLRHFRSFFFFFFVSEMRWVYDICTHKWTTVGLERARGRKVPIETRRSAFFRTLLPVVYISLENIADRRVGWVGLLVLP